ncbi:hypothetical protein BJ165DRAFT_203157 [Panaeolus papilionaceus]|nr:hypothetical protein BJ165DRAFT_203157 [Panaeolus papilionaceus]
MVLCHEYYEKSSNILSITSTWKNEPSQSVYYPGLLRQNGWSDSVVFFSISLKIPYSVLISVVKLSVTRSTTSTCVINDVVGGDITHSQALIFSFCKFSGYFSSNSTSLLRPIFEENISWIDPLSAAYPGHCKSTKISIRHDQRVEAPTRMANRATSLTG